MTNEEALVIQQLATRALGAPADQAVGPVVRAVTSALEARFGTWRMASNLERLPKAKAIVTVADDIEESHNVVSVRIKDAVVWEKAKLVVIGPLRSELVDFAAVWIRTKAGEEGLAAQQLAEALQGGAPASEDIARAADLLREAPREQTMVVCAPNPVSPAIAAAMTGGAANLAIALLGDAASEGLAVLPPEANTGACSTRASARKAARTRWRASPGCSSSATTRRCGCRARRQRWTRLAPSWSSTGC
ncbi:molybdopterin-dependent oxidoreductase [Tepidiforma flava]|uniref:Molybdopterin-dependent oxidoreductase n=1 Tax=Tepidiforma flava TaxID=3004094 RepID=A0ABY7M8R8_9CHLR|nr:molybdopterin-dependent oxidoreductase [Tepidiforma flava]WBL36424.1 molybdopterin-dependent oxidoreductase [Tepidiforma flava]